MNGVGLVKINSLNIKKIDHNYHESREDKSSKKIHEPGFCHEEETQRQ